MVVEKGEMCCYCKPVTDSNLKRKKNNVLNHSYTCIYVKYDLLPFTLYFKCKRAVVFFLLLLICSFSVPQSF